MNSMSTSGKVTGNSIKRAGTPAKPGGSRKITSLTTDSTPIVAKKSSSHSETQRGPSPSQTQSIMANTKWIFVASLLQKLTSFALGQLMLKNTNPEVLGQVSINLELVLSTLLLSREGIRLALLREAGEGGSLKSIDLQLFINLSWIPSFFLILLGLAYLFYSIVIGAIPYDAASSQCFLLYGISALIESIGEPWVNLNIFNINFKPKLVAESTATFTKSLATFAFVSYFELGVLGFSYSQVCYSLVYLAVLIYHSLDLKSESPKLSLSKYLPKRVYLPSNNNTTAAAPTRNLLSFISINSAKLSCTNFLSALFKHLLTEADKITLTLYVSSFNQGIYAFASNYGSLIARMVFLPWEDTSRVAFAKLHSHIDTLFKEAEESRNDLQINNNSSNNSDNNNNNSSSSSSNSNKEKVAKNDDKLLKSDEKSQIETTEAISKSLIEMFETLRNSLVFIVFVSSIFVVFGVHHVRLLVNHIFSSQWSNEETASALVYYCLYIFVLGVNGITESFVNATMTSTKSINTGFIISSIVFGLSSYVFIPRIGTSGIVLANTASMCVRILSSCRYIVTYFDDNKARIIRIAGAGADNRNSITTAMRQITVKSFIPSKTLLSTIVSIFAVNLMSSNRYMRSQKRTMDAFIHIALGAVLGVVYLVVVYVQYKGANDSSIIKMLKRQ